MKVCARCQAVVPNNLLACPSCAMIASRTPDDVRKAVMAALLGNIKNWHAADVHKLIREQQRRLDRKKPRGSSGNSKSVEQYAG